MQETQQMENVEKQEVESAAEGTRGGRLYIPAVDIFEKDNDLTLLADMPGVKAKDLRIDLENGMLRLRGEVTSPESAEERTVAREYGWGSYFREFALADTIDQSKIKATLNDGVLRLVLPKVEAAKPRRIEVTSS